MPEGLKNIGNPIYLPERVDRAHRMSQYIRKTMRVIDLVPVQIRLDHTKILKPEEHAVSYEFKEAMTSYKEDCISYGLAPASGVRCYTTDESTLVDNFTNFYSSSPIQSFIDNMVQNLKLFRALTMFRQIAKPAREAMKTVAGIETSIPENLAAQFAQDQDVSNLLKSLTKSFTNIVVEGKTVSLPKIWESSTYEPSMQLIIKLVSPYGSPKAIKKYVIEPLLYLLILAAPTTNDGLSYGWPRMVHVKYYGSVDLYAAYITSISLRRGGEDSVYSKYRQPLSITVSLTIEPVVPGFASYTVGYKDGKVRWTNPDVKVDELDSYDLDDMNTLINVSTPTALTTVGNIIRSFKPFKTASDFVGETSHVAHIPRSPSPRSNINESFRENLSRSLHRR